MKLIIFPLLFLIVFAVLAQSGLGMPTGEVGDKYQVQETGLWYDADGHAVTYANFTKYGEDGHVEAGSVGGIWMRLWKNVSGSYQMFNTNTGVNVAYNPQLTFDSFSSLGVIGLISCLIVAGAVIGTKIFGIGLGEESLSLVIKGSFFIVLWASLSVFSMPLIIALPLLGVLFYFFLTVIYGLGVINQVGHPGED